MLKILNRATGISFLALLIGLFWGGFFLMNLSRINVAITRQVFRTLLRSENFGHERLASFQLEMFFRANETIQHLSFRHPTNPVLSTFGAGVIVEPNKDFNGEYLEGSARIHFVKKRKYGNRQFFLHSHFTNTSQPISIRSKVNTQLPLSTLFPLGSYVVVTRFNRADLFKVGSSPTTLLGLPTGEEGISIAPGTSTYSPTFGGTPHSFYGPGDRVFPVNFYTLGVDPHTREIVFSINGGPAHRFLDNQVRFQVEYSLANENVFCPPPAPGTQWCPTLPSSEAVGGITFSEVGWPELNSTPECYCRMRMIQFTFYDSKGKHFSERFLVNN